MTGDRIVTDQTGYPPSMDADGAQTGAEELAEWLRLTVQAAVNAVGVAHAQDRGLDIADAFKTEMAARGVPVEDDDWIEGLAAIIDDDRWVVIETDEDKRTFLGLLRPWAARGR
jgi:hypothetical protein